MVASLLTLVLLAAQDPTPAPPPPWVTYPGGEGPGKGRRIVLLAGDEEYRSEEALPMLGKLLSVRLGFECTVLFATDPGSGTIDPDCQTHIPGMEHLDRADLAIVFLRFRELPDEEMAHFVHYVESGRPLIGLRTATHAFAYTRHPDSPYARYDWRRGEDWPGGFGGQILGETWVAHHGHHGVEATRGVIEPGAEKHPILRGVRDVFGKTDVYRVNLPLPEDAQVLLRGAVLAGMTPGSPAVEGSKNDPMIPILWTRLLPREGEPSQRIVCSTIGASVDLTCADLRRALLNAALWCLDLPVPESLDVTPVDPYHPTPFGFGTARKGLRAIDHALGTPR